MIAHYFGYGVQVRYWSIVGNIIAIEVLLFEQRRDRRGFKTSWKRAFIEGQLN